MVAKCTQMVRNAPKHEFRVPWVRSGAFIVENSDTMSLGSHGLDRVLSLRKNPTRLRGTNFCTSSERFDTSFARQPNGRKCTKMVQNAPEHEFRVQWGGLGGFVAKKTLLDFRARTFALVRPVLPRVS